MIVLGAQRDEEVERLGLTPGLLALTRGECPHPALEFYWRGLSYSLEPEDMTPEGLDVIPLFEGESTIVGSVKGAVPARLIRYDVQNLSDAEEVGSSVEDLARLAMEFVESDQWAEVAAALGLPELEEAG